MFEFGEWLPDLPPLNNPGLILAKNVVPSDKTYTPFYSIAPQTDAIDGAASGYLSGQDDESNTFNFTGDTSKLYSLTTAAWGDVSKVGGYATATEGGWEFTQFGQTVIATNLADTMQTWTLGTSTVFTDIVATTGTAPKAKFITTFNNAFLFVAHTDDAVDGVVPTRVRWPGINSYDSWELSSTTLSNQVDLETRFGEITNLATSDNIYFFQEKAITVASPTSDRTVFRFDRIIENKGVTAPKSVINMGAELAFLSDDGFYILSAGKLIPISNGKIDKFFLNDYQADFYYRIVGGWDPIKKLLYWAYPGAQAVAGRPNRLLIYNYSSNATKRWTIIYGEYNYICTYASPGYSLDDLDQFGTMDTLPYSLDSRAWTGGAISFAAFGEDNKLGTFSATPKSAELISGETQLNPKGKTLVTKVRPIFNGSATLSSCLGYRDLQNEDISFTPANTMNSQGEVAFRNNSRYQSIKVATTGDFDDLIGVEIVKASARGDR
ncbi:MAG: hypothetical protein KAS32_02785 [Candidatus Peribacteraceae bacterium]|nr:hypothetical protein [Candidatus Peribacteraceae bacterium]